jgi:hypothetical protein
MSNVATRTFDIYRTEEKRLTVKHRGSALRSRDMMLDGLIRSHSSTAYGGAYATHGGAYGRMTRLDYHTFLQMVFT